MEYIYNNIYFITWAFISVPYVYMFNSHRKPAIRLYRLKYQSLSAWLTNKSYINNNRSIINQDKLSFALFNFYCHNFRNFSSTHFIWVDAVTNYQFFIVAKECMQIYYIQLISLCNLIYYRSNGIYDY